MAAVDSSLNIVLKFKDLATAGLKQAGAQVADLGKKAEDSLSRGSKAAREFGVEVDKSGKHAEQAFDRGRRAANRYEKEVEKVNRAHDRLGKFATGKLVRLGLSLAGGALFFRGARDAVEFGRAIDDIARVTPEAVDDLDALSEKVRDLSLTLGRDATDVARELFEILSTGAVTADEAFEKLNEKFGGGQDSTTKRLSVFLEGARQGFELLGTSAAETFFGSEGLIGGFDESAKKAEDLRDSIGGLGPVVGKLLQLIAVPLLAVLSTIQLSIVAIKSLGLAAAEAGNLVGITSDEDLNSVIASVDKSLADMEATTTLLNDTMSGLVGLDLSFFDDAAKGADSTASATERAAEQMRDLAAATTAAGSAWDNYDMYGAMKEAGAFKHLAASGGGGAPNAVYTGEIAPFIPDGELYGPPIPQPAGPSGFQQGIAAWQKSVGGLDQQVSDFTQNTLTNLTDGTANAFTAWITGAASAEDAFRSFAASFLSDITSMILKMLVFNALSSVFPFATGGVAEGGVTEIEPLAMGGITPKLGKLMPLKGYAAGGPILKAPHVALIGEGSYNEAVVPLPDGRSIPVQMIGSGGATVNFNVQAIDSTSFESWLVSERRTIQDVVGGAMQTQRGFRTTMSGGFA